DEGRCRGRRRPLRGRRRLRPRLAHALGRPAPLRSLGRPPSIRIGALMTIPEISRRSLFAAAGVAAATGAVSTVAPSAAASPPDHTMNRRPPASMRPAYHFSVPDNWKNDPQRPIYVD